MDEKVRRQEIGRAVIVQLRSIAPTDLVLSFDAVSDTLYGGFGSPAINAYSYPIQGNWMACVDRVSKEVVGFEVENVLHSEAKRNPFLLNLLLLAEATGFEPSPVEGAMREREEANRTAVVNQFREKLSPQFAVAHL